MEDRIVYHIEGKPVANFSEAEWEEWAARKRAERAMREAGSGKPGRKKAEPKIAAPAPDAEEV